MQVMGQYCNRLINNAFFLLLSVQTIFCRTSSFIYKKDDPLELSHHLYLTSSKCKSALQCAVACVSSPGCVLAHLNSGNMYRKGTTQNHKTQIIRNYVETQGMDVEETISKVKHDMCCLMVPAYGPFRGSSVYKVSLQGKTTEKTGTRLNDTLQSIVYHRESNMLFWSSKYAGIFQQVMESHSKPNEISGQRGALDLNIYNNKLIYVINDKKIGFIYMNDPMIGNSSDIWLTVRKGRISDLGLDGNLGCWFHLSFPSSINCIEMSSKEMIFTQRQTLDEFSDLALLNAPSFSMLLFSEKDRNDKYFIKAVEVSARGKFEPKTVHHVTGDVKMIVSKGFLVYSYPYRNNVEVFELKPNGSVGEKSFSTRYPTANDRCTVLVTLL